VLQIKSVAGYFYYDFDIYNTWTCGELMRNDALMLGSCVCLPGFYDNSGTCEPCNSSCMTCDGPDDDNCTSCDETRELSGNSCSCKGFFTDNAG